jgi:glycosyltransferase involved in cell wall biosynthesis
MFKGNPPTIGVDCRFAKSRSGIGRYTRELISALKKRSDAHRFVFLDPDIPHYSLQEQLLMPGIIRRAKIDLLHVPHFNIPLFSTVPIVTTIHDLTLHHYPNQTSHLKRLLYRALMRAAIMKSRHILTVSNFAADEIAKTYGKSARKKMTVIYEGVSPHFRHVGGEAVLHIREKYNLYDKFILYVGACKEHKNVQALIDALAHCSGIEAAKHTNHLLLVLVTQGREVSRLHLSPDVRVLRDVTDDELPALYSAASCFVMPSLYEGFGLPVLEAMACGCRVVASNRTSLPEISGSHAILVEPTAEGLSTGIRKALISDDDSAAIQHARSFSWREVAEKTQNIYKKCLAK